MHKLFGYPGGKWPVRHKIVSVFPPHTTYIDVFGGSSAILLTKPPSRGEIYNDKNADIVSFFRVVKHRPAELAELARHWIHARVEFTKMRDSCPAGDEIEKAYRFWILACDSFGGCGRTYGTSREGMHSVTHARRHLDEVSERLQSVHIENLDFQECIRAYDAPESFFYLDPPYVGTRGGNSIYELLSEKEWKAMDELLSHLKGKFLLSSIDHPLIRRIFKHHRMRTLEVPVSLARQKKLPTRRELLISNYALPRARNNAI
jgi:DNA adenine methylase